MAINAKKLSTGAVILYDTEEYTLIVVDKKYVQRLPRSGITENELWEDAVTLAKEGKARMYGEKELNRIADALREVILLRPLLWLQPPKSSRRSRRR